jgi:hypothetical protein
LVAEVLIGNIVGNAAILDEELFNLLHIVGIGAAGKYIASRNITNLNEDTRLIINRISYCTGCGDSLDKSRNICNGASVDASIEFADSRVGVIIRS